MAMLMVAMLVASSFTFFSSNEIEFVVGPYTQNAKNDSITILWETNVATSNNIIIYKNDSVKLYINDSNYGKHHEITIYPPFNHGYYKVISDGKESRWLEFKLASYCFLKKNFKCLILGDSRGAWDNWKNASLIAREASKENADIAIHGGDMVGDGRQSCQWDEWLDLMKPVMQNTTLFAVMGNHEKNASRFYEIFSLPNNEMWYSFDYGICHFTILDNYVPWNSGSSQYKWLENDLKAKKPFKIVCFHEPIYCSGGHSPRKDVREAWEPLFIKNNVTLVIQSHNHYYERSKPINGITYIVTGGAGAPLYAPTPSSIINVSRKAHHYCIINVSWDDEPKMEFMAKDKDGNIIDSFVLYAYHPKVSILKPGNALYVMDREIIPLNMPVIIGSITVEAKANHANKVEFYIDGNLKYEDDTPPYQWRWNEMATGKHEIMVKAYNGASNEAKIDVFAFML